MGLKEELLKAISLNKDKSKLVLVERMVTKPGSLPFRQKFWVNPDQVEKTDKLLGNLHNVTDKSHIQIASHSDIRKPNSTKAYPESVKNVTKTIFEKLGDEECMRVLQANGITWKAVDNANGKMTPKGAAGLNLMRAKMALNAAIHNSPEIVNALSEYVEQEQQRKQDQEERTKRFKNSKNTPSPVTATSATATPASTSSTPQYEDPSIMPRVDKIMEEVVSRVFKQGWADVTIDTQTKSVHQQGRVEGVGNVTASYVKNLDLEKEIKRRAKEHGITVTFNTVTKSSKSQDFQGNVIAKHKNFTRIASFTHKPTIQKLNQQWMNN